MLLLKMIYLLVIVIT